ncbi:PREDICTED: uncharacterized protein LOC109473988 isoform X1 [Branchiostoma belcheri]|uniref:Uncharacterized protein LOC109473988 isoform X1 n=1 Tax=Branchiostoma belcheri TaxID=7741 RepID=A0A6P4YJX8_BRABE|nr:PREDICTED: uncharacterized protein LOC109473988 isoform X1 [Branchiostoma belcheri]
MFELCLPFRTACFTTLKRGCYICGAYMVIISACCIGAEVWDLEMKKGDHKSDPRREKAVEYARGLIYLNFAMYITILLWSVGFIYAVNKDRIVVMKSWAAAVITFTCLEIAVQMYQRAVLWEAGLFVHPFFPAFMVCRIIPNIYCVLVALSHTTSLEIFLYHKFDDEEESGSASAPQTATTPSEAPREPLVEGSGTTNE